MAILDDAQLSYDVEVVMIEELESTRSCVKCGAARKEDDETARESGWLVVREEVGSVRRRWAEGETGMESISYVAWRIRLADRWTPVGVPRPETVRPFFAVGGATVAMTGDWWGVTSSAVGTCNTAVEACRGIL